MTLPWYWTTSWKQTTNVWYRGTSAWLPVKAIWYRTATEWRKVHEWYTPPTEYVSITNISVSGLDPVDVTVEWTQITNPADGRYYYDVNIEWYVGGSLYGAYTVNQEDVASHTIYSMPYDGADECYARCRYVSPGGNGPWSYSSSVYI